VPATATATVPTIRAKAATGAKKEQIGHAHAQAKDMRGVGDPAWIKPYLESLAVQGYKMRAYRDAGVNASTVMRYRDRNPEFETREETAFRKALKNVVEPAIIKRATIGLRKVRYGRDGKILQIEREVSDVLVLRLAERLETGSWRQKQQIEHSGGMTFKTRAERKEALRQMAKELELPDRDGVATGHN
jgi:hypothetical protein